MNEIERFIRQEAMKRGMDPNVVAQMGRNEGGLSDPFKRGTGKAPRSQAKSIGGTEHSFGPFQLYISGTDAGLGDRALKAGIDPRTNWKGGVQFALDEVARDGWKQWYGARDNGIGRWEGVRGAKPAGVTINSAPDGPKGQEAYMPPLTTRPVNDYPVAETALAAVDTPPAPTGPLGDIASLLKTGLGTKEGGEGGPFEKLAGAFGGGAAAQEAQARSMDIAPSNALAAAEGADGQRMQAAQGLMAQIMAMKMKKRMGGMGGMGGMMGIG